MPVTPVTYVARERPLLFTRADICLCVTAA